MELNTDEYFMREALKEAVKAMDAGEVPVGAVVVCQNKIIARAHNQTEQLTDATAHAELLCIKEAALKLGNWRLIDSILYCTLEPCTMCIGALILSRVKTVIWGAPNLFTERPFHKVENRGGVLKEECSQLMKQFFQEQRAKNIR